MKLSEVTVKNYRSIEKQTKFTLGNLTTLIGPNNEGKSNLIRAIDLGMQVIRLWSRASDSMVSNAGMPGPIAQSLLKSRSLRDASTMAKGYSWDEDFPRNKQGISGVQPTLIGLKFLLDSSESAEFTDRTGIGNNGELPIVIKFTRGLLEFGISKPGKGNATHKRKSKEIAKFIDDNSTLVSVPAIRTSRQAVELINQLTRMRTRSIIEGNEYRDLLARINALYDEVNNEVASSISGSLKRYVPTFNSIEFSSQSVESKNTVDDLLIDDGVVTSIDHKGDGIKSLVTMALIHELYQQRNQANNLILAVDEPEAHLHPESIHELQGLFESLAENQQVILASHNPIFVNRNSIGSNILVRDNQAQAARSVKQIRDSLGVLIGDNLESAEVVVLVEGVTEENSLGWALSKISDEFGQAYREHRIVFKATHGTNGLKSAIMREKNTLCKILCILDNDGPGRQAHNVITVGNAISGNDVFLLGGERKFSEYEDMFEPKVYLEKLSKEFNRNFSPEEFNSGKGRWSDKLTKAFISRGLAEPTEASINLAKEVVQNAVVDYQGSPWRANNEDHVMELADWVCRPLRGGAK